MMPVCRFTWKNLKFKYLLLCDIITILLLFATQKHLEGHPAYIMVDQMLYTSISLYFIGTERYFQGPPNFSLTQEQPRAVEVILEAGSEQEEQGSCEDKHPSTTVTSTQSPDQQQSGTAVHPESPTFSQNLPRGKELAWPFHIVLCSSYFETTFKNFLSLVIIQKNCFFFLLNWPGIWQHC